MSTATSVKTATASGVDSSVLARVAREGYGPGAWHGPDLRAALGDVTAEQAFRRPAPGRHNIAEVALHHAFFVRSVRGQLAGVAPEPFVLEGEDWFEVSDESRLTWSQILGVVESQQRRLTETIANLGAGRARPSADVEPFDLVLGITCHAVYHAGQIQLVKRLTERS
jgi:DinB superfamily